MGIDCILAQLDSQHLTIMLYAAIPLLLSLTVHEVAHARTALAFGDNTAHMLGRTSLNPLRHLDPWGTIALFIVGFGWAKPVPVNPANFRSPRLGDIAVTAAGPLSNLGLAVLGCLALKFLLRGEQAAISHPTLLMMLIIFIRVNVVLCVFNLLPLFPLDGHHVMRELLPQRMRQGFMQWQRQFGLIALALLMFAPRVLESATGNEYINPISMMYGWAMDVFDKVGLL
jgi:Zn-dependent protease